MSCHSGVHASQPLAAADGVPALEPAWAAGRGSNGHCPQCGGWLRRDGGCNRCAGGDTLADAIAGPSPTERALSCGHRMVTGVETGAEEWCAACDAMVSVVTASDRVELHEPSLPELEQAWQTLREGAGPGAKFTVEFSEPVRVRVNRRKVKEMDCMTVGLFQGARGGALCYTFYRASGYPLSGLDCRRIRSLSVAAGEEERAKKIRQVESLARSIHPNAWPTLKQEMLAKPETYLGRGLSRINMRSVFGDEVVARLEQAFREKKPFRYTLPGTRRRRSVEVSIAEADGSVVAWYSSEYAGTANGDYYVLLNPHTASLRERD